MLLNISCRIVCLGALLFALIRVAEWDPGSALFIGWFGALFWRDFAVPFFEWWEEKIKDRA